MTENRYLTILLTGDIHDTVNNEILRGSGIARRLNELNDENKGLEQSISDWQGSYDELYKDNLKLEKENKKLKEQLKDCTKKAKEEIKKQREENAIRWANIGR